VLSLLQAPLSPNPNARASSQSYLDTLADNVADAANRRKRSRTRARLVLGAAKVMSLTGYANLRIADIAQAAEVSPGAFYLYFPDRETVAHEVLDGLLGRLYGQRAAEQASETGLGPLADRVAELLAALQANTSLVRALHQATAINPAMARRADHAFTTWLSGLGSSNGAEALTSISPAAFEMRWIVVTGCVRRCLQRRMSKGEIDRLADQVGRACLAAEVRSTVPEPLMVGK